MTPEAQRIAIAEACGWTHVKLDGPHSTVIFGLQPKSNIRWGIPDYLNSLDAMHEAEKVLPKNRLEIYASWLRGGKTPGGSPAELYHWHTTATQRAEAFLRTLNLWTDEG